MSALRLAWLQLTREKLRLLVAVSGVAFAVILIFMQLGFQEALFKSSTRFHGQLNGDLFLINPTQDMIAQPKQISRRRLYQALRFEGVSEIAAVYIGLAVWKNPLSRGTRTIFIVGIDPSVLIRLLQARCKDSAMTSEPRTAPRKPLGYRPPLRTTNTCSTGQVSTTSCGASASWSASTYQPPWTANDA